MSDKGGVIIVSSQQSDGGCCSCSRVRPDYKGRLSIILGVILIVSELALIGLNIGAFIYYATWAAVLFPAVWGFFYIPAGALAIDAGRTKVQGKIVACFVLTIFALVFSAGVFGAASLGIEGEDVLGDNRYDYSKLDGERAIFSTVAFFGVIGVISNIILIVLYGLTMCCGGRSNAQVTYHSQP